MRIWFFGCVVCAVMHPALGAPQLETGDGLEPLPRDTRPLLYRLSAMPDLSAGRFEARALLVFEVLTPTKQVAVNALNLDIESARLVGDEYAAIRYDEPRQRVVFKFSELLPKGRHEIAVHYSGQINDDVVGLFDVDYTKQDGSAGEMLFTHMCCIATARRFAPIWDQPDMKAVFELELILNRNVVAISNMPIAETERISDTLQRVRFFPTPRMSSYLLFFAAGDFNRITNDVGSVEIGVVLQEGKSQQGEFALDAASDAMSMLEDYFDIPYPLPKLDNVGMPGGGSFGAMENWGAIFYFEPYIAVNSTTSTERDRQVIYEVVAHEVAHQWFGNLVTMEWWDDLWLNEAFASWISTKISDYRHPEWGMWLHAARNRENAMSLDARKSTHPVVREVATLEEAILAFDDITYHKGSQIIRMVEAWVGDEAFREAVRSYLRSNTYGNAVTADFVKHLERHSDSSVGRILRDFSTQAGVPLIEVLSTQCRQKTGTSTVTLRQSRFGLDVVSRQPRRWNVPVTLSVVGNDQVVRTVVRGPDHISVETPGCGPVKLNVGEAGYFRTIYDRESLRSLQRVFSTLPVADRLGLLNDSYGLAEGGYQSLAIYFDLSDSLSENDDPMLLLHFVRTLGALDRLFEGMPFQERFRAFVRSRVRPTFTRLGWESNPAEPANTSELRNGLIKLLCQVDDRQTFDEALDRFRNSKDEPRLLPASTRKAVIEAIGSRATPAILEDFKRRASNTVDSAEARVYLLALASAADPNIAEALLRLSISDMVAPQLFPSFFMSIASKHPAAALEFADSHYEQVASKFGSYASVYFAAIGQDATDDGFSSRLQKFSDKHLGEDSEESLERTISSIRHNARFREDSEREVRGWLENR